MPAPKGTMPPGAGMGRIKGSKNKFNKEIKEMITEALEKKGGVDYLAKQADENPVAFMGLVGKLIPKNINLDMSLTEQLENMTDEFIESEIRRLSKETGITATANETAKH